MQAGAELGRRSASLVELVDEPIEACWLTEPSSMQCTDHVAEPRWHLHRVRIAVSRVDELVGDQHVENRHAIASMRHEPRHIRGRIVATNRRDLACGSQDATHCAKPDEVEGVGVACVTMWQHRLQDEFGYVPGVGE